MHVDWIRGSETPNFNTARNWFELGVRGCLPLDEKIITKNGIETIKEFVDHAGGLVLSDEKGVLKYNFGIPVFKGYQTIYRLETSSGVVRATQEHPFLTEDGWKKVSELEKRDKIFILNQRKEKCNYERTTILSITERQKEPVYDLHVENAHNFFLANGILTHNSGKSSLLEHLGELYLHKGHKVLDLFGSRDGEGLAWLRSKWVKDKKILLIHGDNVEIVESPDFVHSCAVSDFNLDDMRAYDIMISASPLYSSPDDEFLQVNRITKLLYRRFDWDKIIYVIVREASNLYYSRLKAGDNQTQAKAQMTYLIREARHMGMAMGLDTLKYTSIDLDIRSVTDYLLFKSQGILGFPSDLRKFLYSFIEPSVARNMPVQNFIMLTRKGALGCGSFPEIPWHKQEKENILKAVGLKLEYGDELDYGQNKGRFTTVDDFEHCDIIKDYQEGKGGMGKIAKARGRSPATIQNQIDKHNKSRAKNGYCMVCARAHGIYAKEVARRPRST